MPYTLLPLPYDYNALEPYIDEQTMRIHHDLHHQAYVNGLNAALEGLAKARQSGDFAAVQQLSRLVAFHGGGHYNHTVFWEIMGPAGKTGGGEPTGALRAQIDADFGSFDAFRKHFSAASAAVEGSGWGVLAWHPAAQALSIQTMMNQQNLTVIGSQPILMIDVWEHAYYLKYQNKRPAYIEAWWNVVNWSAVAARLADAKK